YTIDLKPLHRFFLYHDPPPHDHYTLSLHDALPISTRWPEPCSNRRRAAIRIRPGPPRGSARWRWRRAGRKTHGAASTGPSRSARSEEHTSELQSRENLVCRLLLEKKKQKNKKNATT